ncbi:MULTISPECIES: hypothetical protein [unclassified Rothia (in: high G+C Gram-positive bacteria)]|uniref:hypothetical protein n=1 Tax=unclassified Rothia (in: high G+C Gram-positive bacteria) TaxID=2689056 RepID=UPI0019581C95|nr:MULTISPECIES: hypothetical protein [unclassified Rothia (in: high G+C Gram-positive bacteria)]MBM7052123.1 hypothetical protein [Rothia sp. ZJ1223]QRZ61445.1 hypothetical protein JR346_09520 [Rothia sp. ZJ932]
MKDSGNEFGLGGSCGLLDATGSLGGLKNSASGDFVTIYLPGPGNTTGIAVLAVPVGISQPR